MTDFNINVRVNPAGAVRGSRRVRGELGEINSSAQRTQQLLTRLFAFVGIAESIRRLSGLSDAFTSLQNSIRVAVGATGDVADTLDRVAAIAARTRTPVQQVAELFQRGSVAARELGASQEELLTFTEAVGQGLAAQGGSAAAAEGALRQLSQALGSGIVRAEEFNSVLEGAFPIAQAAARGIDEAGGSVGRLRQLVVDGEVTSREFFDAILSQADSLEAAFALTTPTIGQAFQVLNTGLIRAAEGLTSLAGPLSGFIRDIGLAVSVLAGLDVEEIAPPGQVDRIEALAGAIENVGRAAVAAGVALATVFVAQGITAAVRGLGTLAAAALTNPFTALTLAITATIGVLIAFGDRIQLTAGSSATALDFIVVAFQRLASFARESLGFVLDLFSQLAGATEGFDFLQFVRTVAAGVEQVIAIFAGLLAYLETSFTRGWQTALQSIANLASRSFNVILDGARRLINGLIATLNRISPTNIPLIGEDAFRIPVLFEEQGEIAGNAFVDAYNEVLENAPVQSLVTSIESAAEGRAAGRVAAQNDLAAAPTAGAGPVQEQLTPIQEFLEGGAQNADTFFEGFLSGLDRLILGIGSFSAEAGRSFGDFFSNLSQGFADTIGRAIFDTENLGEALKSVARDAISGLVSSLVQLGLQFVANQVLASTLGAAATTTSAVQAGVVASAWAPAAAATSLATFGANAAPAAAGIGTTFALTEALAAAGSAFADGGFVTGSGGPRDDRILAALSNGEFVMNAAATRRNRGLLEDLNAGRDVGGGQTNVINFTVNAQDADSFRRSQGQIQAELGAQLDRQQRRRT